jgi:hypothetical protein
MIEGTSSDEPTRDRRQAMIGERSTTPIPNAGQSQIGESESAAAPGSAPDRNAGCPNCHGRPVRTYGRLNVR